MEPSMNIDEYINQRVDNQISWYDDKSQAAQKHYKICQTVEILIAAAIPILAAYSFNKIIVFIIAVGGAAISVIESLSRLYKFHENWIEYRVTCELLKYHKHLYLTRSGSYNESEETIDTIFVSNIENIISSENNKWKNINLNKSNEEKTHSS